MVIRCLISLKSLKSDEVHSSGWKLVFQQNQCTVPENTSRLLV